MDFVANARSGNAVITAKGKSGIVTFAHAYANAGKTQTGGYYTMKDMNNSICGAVTIGQSVTLIDVRDNEKYLVAKLEDGRCWMLDNLRLSSTSVTITNQNTNVTYTSAWYLPSSGTADSYTTKVINTQNRDIVASVKYGSGSGKIGTYYNYCAATAGTYCVGGGRGTTDATQDICPVNWRLPTGTPSGEYANLCKVLKGSACNIPSDTNASALTMRNKLSTPMSGVLEGGKITNVGTFGSFWTSSTTYNESGSVNANNMGVFRATTSTVGIPASQGESSYRSRMMTIRCIAK